MVEYCKCEGFSKCSTSWDPYDGKSITQAQSDQYKVGTRIEAFIDTQQLQNVGIFFIKGGIPSMSIYQVILSCQNMFYNDGREVYWDLVSRDVHFGGKFKENREMWDFFPFS